MSEQQVRARELAGLQLAPTHSQRGYTLWRPPVSHRATLEDENVWEGVRAL